MRYLFLNFILLFTMVVNHCEAQVSVIVPIDTILTSGRFTLLPYSLSSYDRIAISYYKKAKFKKNTTKEIERLYSKAQNKIKIYLDGLIFYIDNESNIKNYHKINRDLKASLISIRKLYKYYIAHELEPRNKLLRMYPDRKKIKKVCDDNLSLAEYYRSNFKGNEKAKQKQIDKFKKAYWQGLENSKRFTNEDLMLPQN